MKQATIKNLIHAGVDYLGGFYMTKYMIEYIKRAIRKAFSFADPYAHTGARLVLMSSIRLLEIKNAQGGFNLKPFMFYYKF